LGEVSGNCPALLSANETIGFVLSPDDPEEMMYRSVSLARESSGDFAVVATFAFLGLALSLMAIEKGLLDLEYMTNLLRLF
jgi:hypothetical protein